jgi:hypothetical protein
MSKQTKDSVVQMHQQTGSEMVEGIHDSDGEPDAGGSGQLGDFAMEDSALGERDSAWVTEETLDGEDEIFVHDLSTTVEGMRGFR